MLEKSIGENFMSEAHRKMWTFVDEPEKVIGALNNAPQWNEDAIEFAVSK
jgi:predicted Rossmann-fold nucleotide-binding protein